MSVVSGRILQETPLTEGFVIREVAFLQKWARKVNETGDSSNYAIFIKESRRSGFDKNETLKLRKDVFSIFDFNDNE